MGVKKRPHPRSLPKRGEGEIMKGLAGLRVKKDLKWQKMGRKWEEKRDLTPGPSPKERGDGEMFDFTRKAGDLDWEWWG